MNGSCWTAMALGVLSVVGGSAAMSATWPTSGNDSSNSRSQPGELIISSITAPLLKPKWTVNTDSDVTGTPAVDATSIYFTDFAGFVYKVSRATGQIVWKFPVSQYTGVAGDFARSTPALVNGMLILGDQSGRLPSPQPAHVFAVNATTGALVWSTQVDPTVMSYVTPGLAVYNGTVFAGLASNEELQAGFVSTANGWTWHFRGSVVALNAATGAIKWRTYTVPAGYYGGAVWGSMPAVNPLTNTVYVSTGNNYWVPAGAQACLRAGGAPANCLAANDYFDSILAMDITTGLVKWVGRGLPYDAYNVGCGLNIPGVIQVPPNDNCPNPKGPDYDFGQGPLILNSSLLGGTVGAGQKSGRFWTFDSNIGFSRWSTQVGPGGSTGGMLWGSATDGFRVYVAIANTGGTDGSGPAGWTLKDGTVVYSGGWAALDAGTGALLWTTPDPNGGFAQGAVSVAGGVSFGCSLDASGTMHAFNATTGAIIWSYASGSPCSAAASIADGTVYWGSGTGNGAGPHKVYAFSVNGL